MDSTPPAAIGATCSPRRRPPCTGFRTGAAGSADRLLGVLRTPGALGRAQLLCSKVFATTVRGSDAQVVIVHVYAQPDLFANNARSIDFGEIDVRRQRIRKPEPPIGSGNSSRNNKGERSALLIWKRIGAASSPESGYQLFTAASTRTPIRQLSRGLIGHGRGLASSPGRTHVPSFASACQLAGCPLSGLLVCAGVDDCAQNDPALATRSGGRTD